MIDFDALFTGDPAADLAAAWVLLPAGGVSHFSPITAKQTTPPFDVPADSPC